MLRKLTAIVLCLCLLISGITVTATAAEEQPTPSLHQAARLFYAVAGKITLHPQEEALADLNGDGNFTLEDATAAFYLASGMKAPLRALAFDAYLWQLGNAASLPDDPLMITDHAAMNTFFRTNAGFIQATWMMNVDFDTQALLAVPLKSCNSYVSAVSTDATAVYVSLVTLPTKPDIPYTAYAFITVDKDAVIGKTIAVSSTAETDTVVTGRDLYGQYDCSNAYTGGSRRIYGVNASETKRQPRMYPTSCLRRAMPSRECTISPPTTCCS